MEIYFFYGFINRLMDTIYAVGAVAFGILALGLIIYLIVQIVKSRKEEGRFPLLVIVLFLLVVAVPAVASIGLGSMFVKSATYNSDMKNGNALYLTGDVEIISCEEEAYRGEPTGNYIVEIKVGETTIKPSNGFPKNVIEYFEGDEELVIQYGIIKGDGLYVWSIRLL